MHFLEWRCMIFFIKISPNFVSKGQFHNTPTLVQIMAWHRPGDKPLSEPMMVSLLTHLCVTRPQWVNANVSADLHFASRTTCYYQLSFIKSKASVAAWVQMLTHWGRDKIATISQTTFSNAFSLMKMYEFRIRFHWSLFPWFKLTIFHHWFW